MIKYQKCDLCGKDKQTETHHIFGGSNRKWSEKYKLVVQVCRDCHRRIHEDTTRDEEGYTLMERLHENGEMQWIVENNGTREEFIKIFGKNYL